MAKRDLQVDHAFLIHRVIEYWPDIVKAAQTKKQVTAISW